MSWAIGVVAAIVGLGLPALILIDNGDAQEKHGPGGIELTAAQISGRHLFAQNCATCHTLDGAAAVGKVGPNLDQLRPPKVLVLNAIAGRARARAGPDAGAAADRQGRRRRRFVRRRRRRPLSIAACAVRLPLSIGRR